MTDDLDVVLAETIARHFPEATTDGAQVDLGFGDLHMACSVPNTPTIGAVHSASCFLRLWGGVVGPVPVFLSISGYADDTVGAVVTGGCSWACTFGPLLRAGLAGELLPGAPPRAAAVGGVEREIYVEALDRLMSASDASGRVHEVARRARQRLGGEPWLVDRFLGSTWLPLVDAERATIVSVFVGDSAEHRVVEVKVNGCDWPAGRHAFGDSPAYEGEGTILLRELAVIAPRTTGVEPRLERAAISRTLEGLTAPVGDSTRGAADWPGWRAHGGVLEAPLTEAACAEVERHTGPLPADYRAFLVDVAAGGAGPGYGLIAPTSAISRRGVAGTFVGQDGARIEADPAGVLRLADAGCGVSWVLVLEGANRGEVWAVATGSDEQYHRVASSFTRWYVAWLDAAVRNVRPFTQWAWDACATPGLLSQLIDQLDSEDVSPEQRPERVRKSLAPGAISLRTGGHLYAEAGTELSPCETCVRCAENVGLPPDRFRAVSGERAEVAEAEAEAEAAVPAEAETKAPRSWWRRLLGR